MGNPPRPNKKMLVYNFIKDFLDKREYAPTLSEICAGCGLSGKSHADYYVQALRSDGLISFEDKKIRTIRLVQKETNDEEDF